MKYSHRLLLVSYISYPVDEVLRQTISDPCGQLNYIALILLDVIPYYPSVFTNCGVFS